MSAFCNPPKPPAYGPDDYNTTIDGVGHMKIAAKIVHHEYIGRHERRPMIIYSHDAHVDLKAAIFEAKQLQVGAKADVLVYDYPGYGHSLPAPPSDDDGPAPPSMESDWTRCLLSVYLWLTLKQGTKIKDVILYGKGMGTGPTLNVALERPEIQSVVLEAPMLSALRISTPIPLLFGRLTWMAGDIFLNFNVIAGVKARILIIHWKDDPRIPYYHGKALFECIPTHRRTPKPEKAWIPTAMLVPIPSAEIKTNLLQDFTCSADRILATHWDFLFYDSPGK